MPALYANPKNAYGFCPLCSFRYPRSAFKKQVVAGQVTNSWRCPECLDKDHPQLRLGKVIVNDPQAIRDPLPPIEIDLTNTVVLDTVTALDVVMATVFSAGVVVEPPPDQGGGDTPPPVQDVAGYFTFDSVEVTFDSLANTFDFGTDSEIEQVWSFDRTDVTFDDPTYTFDGSVIVIVPILLSLADTAYATETVTASVISAPITLDSTRVTLDSTAVTLDES